MLPILASVSVASWGLTLSTLDNPSELSHFLQNSLPGLGELSGEVFSALTKLGCERISIVCEFCGKLTETLFVILRILFQETRQATENFQHLLLRLSLVANVGDMLPPKNIAHRAENNSSPGTCNLSNRPPFLEHG